jgi:hypothetical protein
LKVTVTNTDALPYVVSLFPEEDGDIETNVTQMGGQAVTASAGVTVNAEVGASAAAMNNFEDAFDGTGYDLGGIDVSELNSIVDDWLNAGRLDVLLNAVKAVTDLLPDSGALTSLAQASVCTETRLAELDAANLPADIASIPTNPMLATEDGSSFSAIPDMATATNQTAIIGYVNTEIADIITHLTDIKGGTFNGTTDSLEAIRNQGDSAWITATSVTVSDKTGFSLASTGLDLVTTWTVDITGTVSGNSTHDAAAVKTAIEAAGSHLALILADTGTDGVKIADGAITAAKIASAALTAAKFFDVDGKTLQEAVQYISAVAAGILPSPLAGSGTETFKGLDKLTDRVSFTVDASGNRTAVTYDP